MKTFLKIATILFFFVLMFCVYVLLQIPSEKEIRGCMTTKMYHVSLCPGSKDYVPLGAISAYMQRAVVISEDANFWNHKGFDWEELEKSARENWEKGEYKRGGSTITQQLAKNMFLSKDKSITRKLVEALITGEIEKALKKKEILERYLNVVEFGKGTFGVKAAASYYFKKSPSELSLVESAFLTMLLPSPQKYARSFHQKTLTKFAQKRVRRIVTDLERTGKVSQEEAGAALAQMDTIFRGEAEEGAASLPDEESPDTGAEDEE